MAKVPGYDSFQVSPQGGGAPQFARPDTSGFLNAGRSIQQMGEAISSTASDATNILVDRQNRINEAAVKEADAALADRVRDVLTNPEKGYLNQAGKNAVDGYKGANEALKQIFTESANTLTNPAQRELWADALRRRQSQAAEQIDAHYTRESKVYAVQGADARIRSAMMDGAAHWTDDKAQVVAKATVLHEVDNIGQLKGLGPDEMKLARLDATTKFYAGVMSAMLTNDQGDRALAYFATHEDEIDPTKRDEIKNHLKEVSIRSDSMKLADRLEARYAGTDAQFDETQRMFQAGEISAELRDATEQRLWASRVKNEQLQDWRPAEGIGDPSAIAPPNEAGVRGMIGRFFPTARITSGARAADDPLSIANPRSHHNIKNGGNAIDVAPIPGVTFNQYVGTLRANGLNIIEAIEEVGAKRSKWATGDHWHIAYKGAAPNAKIKTDPAAEAVLVDAIHDDPMNFAKKFNAAEWADKLSPADLNHYKNKARSILEGGQDKLGKISAQKNALGYLTNELKAIGIKPGEDKSEAYPKFKIAFEKRVAQEQDKVGRPLTEPEMVAIGRGLMVEGTVETGGWFGGAKKRFYELSPSEKRNFSYGGKPAVSSYARPLAQIPAASRKWIEANWQRSYGRAPTPNEIVGVYPNLKAKGVVQ